MRKKPAITPPENLVHQKLEIIEQKRKYELITPLYGGGITTKEANPSLMESVDPITTIRATEIRGQLRFWWRAIRGGQSENEPSLKKREETIWGKAYEKGDKGIPSEQIVQVVVDVVQEGTPIKPFRMQGKTPVAINDIPGYVAFPLQPDQKQRMLTNPPIPTLRKGVQFLLTITYPARLRQDIEAALWAWETFGGVGARTRRGFGALHLVEIDGKPYRSLPASRNAEQWIQQTTQDYMNNESFPQGLPHLSNTTTPVVTPAVDTPMQAWNHLIRAFQKFRQRKDESAPGAQFEKDYNKHSAWPEADTIRAIASTTGLTPRTSKFPRAAFGLPIIFHFTGKNAPAGNYTLNEADKEHQDDSEKKLSHKERFASPLILRPFQCSDGKAVGLALLLEGSRVDLKYLVLQPPQNEQKNIQAVEGTLTPDEARMITKKLPELNNKTDVLHAFLQFLKPER